MKKIIILLSLFTFINVYAAPIYSDYTFTEYSTTKGIEDEFHKYEVVNLHRYYKMGETNVKYAPYEVKFEDSPYIDTNDTKVGAYYRRNRADYGEYEHKEYYRQDIDYNVKMIKFYNFALRDNLMNEIEIYHKRKKVNYSIEYDYNFLNDNDNKIGFNIAPKGFVIELDKPYNIRDLKIVFHYSITLYNSISFYLNMVNDGGGKEINHPMGLDNLPGQYKKTTVEFIGKDDFIRILTDNHMVHPDLYTQLDLNYCYVYNSLLYKHYNIGKVYYILSPLDKLDGYTYDENEDVIGYRVYERSIIGEEKEDIVFDTKKGLVEGTVTETIIKDDNQNNKVTREIINKEIKPKSMSNNSETNLKEETNDDNNDLYYNYHVTPLNKESSNKMLSNETNKLDIKKESTNEDKISTINIILIIVEIILFISFIFKLIKSLRK